MRIKTLSSIIAILLCIGISAFAALDLQFTTAITQTPNPANTGNIVTFKVTFKNVGGAVDGLKVTGGIDGSKIFERTYAHINANLQRTDSFTWVATAGSHTAWFELDPGHTTGDSNYGNNRVEKAFTVTGTGGEFSKLPEKFIMSFLPDWIVESLEIIPASPQVNDNATLKAIIKNIGKGQAPETTLMIRVCVNDGYGYTVYGLSPSIPSLPPGGTYEFTDSGQWFKTQGAGIYWALVSVRYGYHSESNKRNNSKEIIFTVVP